MTAQPLDVEAVAVFLREFAEERDWVQYHSPKNLAMALAAEAGELLDIFQWMTADESHEAMTDPEIAIAIRGELADVAQYLIRLADLLDVDLSEEVWKKVKANETRFPVG